jgi:hypothetical protein
MKIFKSIIDQQVKKNDDKEKIARINNRIENNCPE